MGGRRNMDNVPNISKLLKIQGHKTIGRKSMGILPKAWDYVASLTRNLFRAFNRSSKKKQFKCLKKYLDLIWMTFVFQIFRWLQDSPECLYSGDNTTNVIIYFYEINNNPSIHRFLFLSKVATDCFDLAFVLLWIIFKILVNPSNLKFLCFGPLSHFKQAKSY